MNTISKPKAPALRRGVSLIEGVLYLVIALAIIIGGIVLFQRASMQSKVTDFARNMQALSGSLSPVVRNYTSKDGVNDMSTYIVNSGMAPANLINGERLVTPWGGEIYAQSRYVSLASHGGAYEPALFMIIRDLPTEACVQLLARDEGYNTLMGSFRTLNFNNLDGEFSSTEEAYASWSLTMDVLADRITRFDAASPTDLVSLCQEHNAVEVVHIPEDFT